MWIELPDGSRNPHRGISSRFVERTYNWSTRRDPESDTGRQIFASILLFNARAVLAT
jgi:hypothetical protein